MRLSRLHAFAVVPSKGATTAAPPVGGTVKPSTAIARLLARNVDQRTPIDFLVDERTRTNDVRDRVLGFAFGAPAQAVASSAALAERLAGHMDGRSSEALLILAAYETGAKMKRVAMWTFPQDDALRMVGRNSKPGLRLLTDVFSKSSPLRKAAVFEGRNHRSAFLQGHALDLQSGRTSAGLAAFWMKFLACELALAGAAGTRILAEGLRRVIGETDAPEHLAQIYSAIHGLKSGRWRRASLTKVANEYLDDDVRALLFQAAPNQKSISAEFDLDRVLLGEILKIRMFRLESNVIVAAPLEAVGKDVTVTDQGGVRRIRCEGTVSSENVRARYG